MFRLKKLVQALQAAEVDFVIVGGVAMSAHGSAHVTQDLDVCYSRAPDNLERLVQALALLKPRLRVEGEPEELPFLWDAETLRRGLNFTLMTHHGDVDLLGEVSGLGAYCSFKPSLVQCGFETRPVRRAESGERRAMCCPGSPPTPPRTPTQQPLVRSCPIVIAQPTA